MTTRMGAMMPLLCMRRGVRMTDPVPMQSPIVHFDRVLQHAHHDVASSRTAPDAILKNTIVCIPTARLAIQPGMKKASHPGQPHAYTCRPVT